MKKTFKLTSERKKPERQLDSVKHEIKKYISRERRKKLPEGADFWDFDCKIGANEESSSKVMVHELNAKIDALFADKEESFYLEVLSKTGNKPNK